MEFVNAMPQKLAGRMEWYLCLTRAFLPPRNETAYQALTGYLANDLEQLGTELGYPLAATLDDLRTELARVPERQNLLRDYSKLFLTPPVPVHLNVCLYLDGALMGGSVKVLEDHYQRYGVARSEHFHDLPDHISMQLEYLAYLFGSATTGKHNVRALLEEADWFLKTFVLAWAPPFCSALERAVSQYRVTGIYLHLARLLYAAAMRDTDVLIMRIRS